PSKLILLFMTSPASLFFFFNDTAPPEIYTLSLHDALPIFAGWTRTSIPSGVRSARHNSLITQPISRALATSAAVTPVMPSRYTRSEEHTSELQSRENLVCRLLLEKKKNKNANKPMHSATTH